MGTMTASSSMKVAGLVLLVQLAAAIRNPTSLSKGQIIIYHPNCSIGIARFGDTETRWKVVDVRPGGFDIGVRTGEVDIRKEGVSHGRVETLTIADLRWDNFTRAAAVPMAPGTKILVPPPGFGITHGATFVDRRRRLINRFVVSRGRRHLADWKPSDDTTTFPVAGSELASPAQSCSYMYYL